MLLSWCLALTMIFAVAGTAQAQQLEPRAYSPAPVGLNFLGLGYLFSSGGVVTDPASLIQNVQARVSAVGPYYGHTFGLFGRLANVTVATPLAEAHVHGDVQDVGRSVERSGLLDPQVRFAVNLLGGPALTPQEFREHRPETTLGASLIVSAPLGEYDSTKLVNLGTNRWACKPELGLSQPAGNWTFELYAGVWLFEANDNFFGGQVRRQDPLASYQAHIVYEVRPRLWAAADFTYYAGGETTVNGNPQNDRQGNTRGGLTLSFPIKQDQSLKLTWARGVSTRVGSSFDTMGIAWQWTWL
ncbi:MAG TPA: transporter [Nitrospirota bacterium]|nr:transporter [Nitrospirota bacterium]